MSMKLVSEGIPVPTPGQTQQQIYDKLSKDCKDQVPAFKQNLNDLTQFTTDLDVRFHALQGGKLNPKPTEDQLTNELIGYQSTYDKLIAAVGKIKDLESRVELGVETLQILPYEEAYINTMIKLTPDTGEQYKKTNETCARYLKEIGEQLSTIKPLRETMEKNKIVLDTNMGRIKLIVDNKGDAVGWFTKKRNDWWRSAFDPAVKLELPVVNAPAASVKEKDKDESKGGTAVAGGVSSDKSGQASPSPASSGPSSAPAKISDVAAAVQLSESEADQTVGTELGSIDSKGKVASEAKPKEVSKNKARSESTESKQPPKSTSTSSLNTQDGEVKVNNKGKKKSGSTTYASVAE